MRAIKVEKVTLNIGAGKDAQLLEKGVKLLEMLTGIAPVKTQTQKRIPNWGLRPGLPIGCKLTLRGKAAQEIIPKLLVAKDARLSRKNYDEAGNISFGIPEYIDIEGAQYDPAIGIMGLQASITLTRPGYRTKRRRYKTAPVGKRQRITQEESISFMQQHYNVKLTEESA